MNELLSVKNLTVELKTKQGVYPVLDNLSFCLGGGEVLSFVGESGCGKSMTALSIMGLLPEGVAHISGGEIMFGGENLVKASNERLSQIRGKEISMIFQEPMTSLNPLYTIGEQIAEILRRHEGLSKKAAWVEAIEWLAAVHIPEPNVKAKSYPHQLSGGQRQRVMIAGALACRPKILIADEPTTALDVTVQAQIFELLEHLTKQSGTAQILITHDMGLVSQIARRMIVMYGGRKIEEGFVGDILSHPRHPYTKGLISCVPHLTSPLSAHRKELVEIKGIVPPLQEFGVKACMFSQRCEMAKAKCLQNKPPELFFNNNHSAACFFANEV